MVVDVTKLCVAIDVSTAFPRLAVCLQAVVHPAEQIAHNRRANLVPLLPELFNEVTQAPAGPQERSHGVATRRRLDESLEIAQQIWILKNLLLSPTAQLADTPRRRRHIIANVGKTMINGGASQTRDAGH